MKTYNLTFRKIFMTSAFFFAGIMIWGGQLIRHKSVLDVVYTIILSALIFAISNFLAYRLQKRFWYSKFLLIKVFFYIGFSAIYLSEFEKMLPFQNPYYGKNLVLPLILIVLLFVSCYAAKSHFAALEGALGLFSFAFLVFLTGILTCFLNTKTFYAPHLYSAYNSFSESVKSALLLFGDSIAICSLLYCPESETLKNAWEKQDFFKCAKNGLYIGAFVSFIFLFIIWVLYVIVFSQPLFSFIQNPHLTVTKLFALFEIPEIYTFIICMCGFIKLSVYFSASYHILKNIFPDISDKIVYFLAFICFITSLFIKDTL